MGLCSKVYQLNDDKTCDKHFVTSPQYLINHIQVVLQELIKKNPEATEYKQSIHMHFDDNGNMKFQIKLEEPTNIEKV